MAVTYTIYRVRLPSGGVVRARKADRFARLAKGILAFPLLSAAAKAVPADPRDTTGDQLDAITDMCRIALVDDLDPELLPLGDRTALAAWASSRRKGTAVRESRAKWQSIDFAPLVAGKHAVLIDAACVRYGPMRPSALLQLSDSEISFDLDIAIAYRALVGERQRATGEEEVEVEDLWGRKYQMPRRMLPDIPAGAKIVDADAYARTYGPCAFSAGGALDGQLGPLATQTAWGKE